MWPMALVGRLELNQAWAGAFSMVCQGHYLGTGGLEPRERARAEAWHKPGLLLRVRWGPPWQWWAGAGGARAGARHVLRFFLGHVNAATFGVGRVGDGAWCRLRTCWSALGRPGRALCDFQSAVSALGLGANKFVRAPIKSAVLVSYSTLVLPIISPTDFQNQLRGLIFLVLDPRGCGT